MERDNVDYKRDYAALLNCTVAYLEQRSGMQYSDPLEIAKAVQKTARFLFAEPYHRVHPSLRHEDSYERFVGIQRDVTLKLIGG